MNISVKFPIAELLKEKGFICRESNGFWMDSLSYSKKDYNPITYQDKDNIATIAEVVMWLYEKHGIWVEVGYGLHPSGFYFGISTINPHQYLNQKLISDIPPFNSPTECYEAAIEYTLNNLI